MTVTDSDVITSSVKQSQDNVVAQNYGKLPLAFEPNQGQAENSISYLVHHGKATTYFNGLNATTIVGDDHITMSLDRASTPNFIGADQLESKTNYFIDNDKSKWQKDVPNYQQILAKNVYPGIDLKYYGTNSQLEHDFIVNPGSDYRQIAFHFDGQEQLDLDKNGNLNLKIGDQSLTLNAPITYQQAPHSKHTIPSEFVLVNDNVTIALKSDFDHSLPLIIDPTLTLTYSTYYGGTGADFPYAVALDSSGNTYVAGITTSTTFPYVLGFHGSYSGLNPDVVVTKLNAAGSAAIYSTYIGSASGPDVATGIAVDSSGSAYITGYTSSSNYPVSAPYQGTSGGSYDAFITKLNTSGDALTYSTFLGGSQTDQAFGITLDVSGNAYIAGQTSSVNYPTASPFQVSKAGAGGTFDFFVTKLNTTGAALIYSTYLGGALNDTATGIDLDASENVYVSGYTVSTDFPTSSPYQASKGSGTDGILARFNYAGSALVYSTYLGGVGNDGINALSVDSTGNAYTTGYTNSAGFPTTSGVFQATRPGSSDAFVTKFNPSGSTLIYSTFLGGTVNDVANGIGIDASGNTYITGYTEGTVNSTLFPTVIPYQSFHKGGTTDVFVSKLNPTGTALLYSTYLGGNSVDRAYAIAVNPVNGSANVVGSTQSVSTFPTVNPIQSTNANTQEDFFITQITDNTLSLTGDPVNLEARVDPTLTFTIGSTTCALGSLSVSQTQFCTYAITAATNGTTGYTISYKPVVTLTSGGNTITALSSQTSSTLNTEQFGINLRANTAIGSHTASAFGADVSGGSGTVASAYNTANSFKFVAAGDTIAQSSVASLTSTYTVSTIGNITNATEAGAYTTTLTYNIVAGY